MDKKELLMKNFEEFIDDIVDYEKVEDLKIKLCMANAICAATILTFVGEDNQEKVKKLLIDYESDAERLGIVRLVSDLSEEDGDASE